jgi:hypothetical protein
LVPDELAIAIAFPADELLVNAFEPELMPVYVCQGSVELTEHEILLVRVGVKVE